MRIRTLALIITIVLLAPSVRAQSLTDPVERHVDEKEGQARSDPVAFARDHASPEGLEEEAAWTIAYACFAQDVVDEDEIAPRIEECDDYEDALGLPDEEEPVAIADEFEEEPVSEAAELADEGLEAVADVIEDPGRADKEVVGFVDAIVDFALARLTDIQKLIDEASEAALSGPAALARVVLSVPSLLGHAAVETEGSIGSCVDGIRGAMAHPLASALGEGVAMFGDSAGEAKGLIEGLGETISEAGSRFGAAIAKGTDGIADAFRAAAGSVGEAFADVWQSLFGDGEAEAPVVEPDLEPALPDVVVDRLCVECLVDEAVAVT